MSDKLEALKAKKPADTKSLKSQAAGYVTDDNTGGYYVVECQEYGAIYPSQQSAGGSQIADTGDYNDSYCPHCGQVDPDECDNVGLVWNVQQAKINALLAALERSTKNEHALGGLLDEMTRRRDSQANRANAAEQREEHLKATVDVLSAKNAELQQRLQQPIKLPDYDTNDYGYKSLSNDEVVAALKEQGFKVEGE